MNLKSNIRSGLMLTNGKLCNRKMINYDSLNFAVSKSHPIFNILESRGAIASHS